MPFNTKAVTNYVLELADRDSDQVSPMRLQKLLYFSHGWHLGLGQGPLIDDRVEAWKWGPVIPSVYHEFKQFGTENINNSHRWYTNEITSIEGRRITVQRMTPSLDAREGNIAAAKAVVEKVWTVYKPFSAIQLSNITHQPGTPWDEVWNNQGGKGRRSTDIPDELIERYFKQLHSK
jgi:uncharacterized phage-associated protein